MAETKSGNPSSVREDGTYGSSKDGQYDYVLRYIAESIDYRTKKVGLTARAIEAYKGFPSRDGYINGINNYASMWDNIDNQKAESIRTRCKTVTPRKNMIVMRAIDSMVAQAQGGVGQFECEVSDPTFQKTPELVDSLNAAAMDFYRKNHIDSALSVALEYAGLSGSVYSYLEYDKDRDLSEGKIVHNLIPDTEMLIDPIGAKRNRDRYIGHQDKNVAWADLKDHLIKNQMTDNYELRSINEVDTMLSEVEYWINKYNGDFSQIMPAIARTKRYDGNPMKDLIMENLPHQIDTFYNGAALAWRERNTEYKKNGGGTNSGDGDTRYRTSDVEVCYLIDLKNDIRFTVVNRKFIVAIEKHPYSANLNYQYFVMDPYSNEPVDMDGVKKVKVDSPYVPLAYKKSLWEAFPYSPIVHVLDMFDDICALETMIYHTISVMTPITFTGNPKDIEKLGAIAGVSGEAIKGFIANSVTVLNKAVDLTPAMSEISRLEGTIMSVLHGVDNKEQAQMIGNRATAAEAMQAASLVSQGLNSIIANVETWAEQLATKMMRLTIIYEDEDFVYDLDKDGQHVTLSRKDLAGDYGIHAVLKSRIKAEQHAQAANTIQWFVPLMGSDAIVNKEAFAESIIPTLAEGFTRKTIMSWFIPTEEQKRAQEAQLELMKKQAQAAQAQINASKPFEPGFVDPTSGGKYGEADIAMGLGVGADDPQAEADFNARATDQRSSNSLGRGISPAYYGGDAEVSPSNYPKADGSAPITVPLGPGAVEAEEPIEDIEGENEMPLNALGAVLGAVGGDQAGGYMNPAMNPSTGGIQANNGIYGANSPLNQQTLLQ